MTESRPSHRAIAMALRNILMNEMGLTRESVRKQMETIVSSTVEKLLNADTREQLERRIIDETVRRLESRWGRETLSGVIEKATRSTVEKYVRDQLQVQVRLFKPAELTIPPKQEDETGGARARRIDLEKESA